MAKRKEQDCPVPRHGDRPDCWFDGEPCDEHKEKA